MNRINLLNAETNLPTPRVIEGVKSILGRQ
jgi:hypothetical protein